MNAFRDDIYLIFACRLATTNDQEVDFIVGDEKLVVEAASKANMHNLEEKQSAIVLHHPKHKILVTHQPLFNLIDTLGQLAKLEVVVIAGGNLVGDKPTGRIVDAFDWENKHDGARQIGRC